MRFTDKDYAVRSVLDAKKVKGIGLIYLARVGSAAPRWVIGHSFKTIGNKIPKGTPYFAYFDKAMKGFDNF